MKGTCIASCAACPGFDTAFRWLTDNPRAIIKRSIATLSSCPVTQEEAITTMATATRRLMATPTTRKNMPRATTTIRATTMATTTTGTEPNENTSSVTPLTSEATVDTMETKPLATPRARDKATLTRATTTRAATRTATMVISTTINLVTAKAAVTTPRRIRRLSAISP